MLKKHQFTVSQLIFFQSQKFDAKVKAVKDSEETKSNVIEEYQVIRYIAIPT